MIISMTLFVEKERKTIQNIQLGIKVLFKLTVI